MKTMENKICDKCCVEKPNTIEYFYGNGNATKDGLTKTCKICVLNRRKQLQKKNECIEGIKKCSKCNVEKHTDYFYKDITKKGGYSHMCKECAKKKDVKIRSAKKITPKTKVCSDCGIEKSSNDFYKDKRNKTGISCRCKDCASLLNKIYLENETPERRKNRLSKNRKKYREYTEAGQFPCGITLSESSKIRTEKYKPKRKIAAREYRNNNPIVKLREGVFGGITRGLKGKSKLKSTIEILGCSFEYFREYIENQFDDRMTWDNWSKFGWHLDHIIPLSLAETEEDVYKLNHYTNFQPLWWEDNLKKSDNISEEWGNVVSL